MHAESTSGCLQRQSACATCRLLLRAEELPAAQAVVFCDRCAELRSSAPSSLDFFFQPQRGVLSQPRAAAWVEQANPAKRDASPEGARYKVFACLNHCPRFTCLS